jgi:hypothetical protein
MALSFVGGPNANTNFSKFLRPCGNQQLTFPLEEAAKTEKQLFLRGRECRKLEPLFQLMKTLQHCLSIQKNSKLRSQHKTSRQFVPGLQPLRRTGTGSAYTCCTVPVQLFRSWNSVYSVLHKKYMVQFHLWLQVSSSKHEPSWDEILQNFRMVGEMHLGGIKSRRKS